MAVVLVTGGGGYIGSHTCKALAQAGHVPVVVDNLVTGHDWAVRWGPFERGDIRDADFLDRVFERWTPSAVIHFAALSQVGESVIRPDLYYDNNVRGTIVLLDQARRHGVQRLVFSSTCAIFGQPAVCPIHEDLPVAPISPYGASKAMIERLLCDYGAAFGLRSVALRYFNAAGADPEGQVGEAHQPETHLIPIAIEVAQGKRAALQIFGDDYPTADGTCIRDYIHVNDLADAHVRALDYLEEHDGCTPFNLGSGSGYSVRQVVEAVGRAVGRPVRVKTVGRRPGDPPVLIADSRRSERDLGWRPHWTSLDDIVASAWRWHESRSAEHD